MTPFWPLYIEPVLRALKPDRLMQIGAGDGEVSLRLLAYCRETGCHADIIDPRPSAGLNDALAAYGEDHAFQRLQPWKAVPLGEPPDLVLLDGEPNWWAVFTLLDRLRRLAGERGCGFPVVLVHHVAWPYGRRDMYPAPDVVGEPHPFAYLGVAPGDPGLIQDGLDSRFAHAIHEGGPQNGVLTALEDFVASAPLELELRVLPLLSGLGILAPVPRMTPELRTMIDDFASPDASLQAVEAASREALRLAARLAETEARLERRTTALIRARELLAQQEADLLALRQRLAGKAGPDVTG